MLTMIHRPNSKLAPTTSPSHLHSVCTFMWRGQHIKRYSKPVRLKGSNKALKRQLAIDAR